MANKIKGLPESEEFDFELWRIDFQFAIMLNIRYGLEKRYMKVQNKFKQITKDYLSLDQTKIAIEKIVNSAYLTIPEEFYREAERYNGIPTSS